MDGLFRILGTGAFEEAPGLEGQLFVDAEYKKATLVRADIKELRQTVDRLSLITRALWEIVAKSQGLSDDDLVNKVNEIDLRDGVLDGKIREPVRKCSSCGKVLQQGYIKCIYCGAKSEGTNPFKNTSTDSRSDLAQGLT